MSRDYAMFRDRMGTIEPEQRYILDMVIPLTRAEAVARYERLGYGELKDYGDDYYLFTCRHWDEETRLCTAYESRPSMCSRYPYGSECERGCGYSNKVSHRSETWEWDDVAKGWRPKSSDNWLWDAEAGVLRAIPEPPA